MGELAPDGMIGWVINTYDSDLPEGVPWGNTKSFTIPLLQGVVIQRVKDDAPDWCRGVPNPDSPLNGTAAREFKNNMAKYKENVIKTYSSNKSSNKA